MELKAFLDQNQRKSQVFWYANEVEISSIKKMILELVNC